ncbi:MAG: tetratricopeptide repeat protein [Woeseiaceae bacterium]
MTLSHRICLICLLLAVLFVAAAPEVRAQSDNDNGIAAAGHLIEGENALQAGEYLTAAREYRKAAELSENVDVARKATHIGMRLGFNGEALLAAARWLELDENNDEAKLVYAQLQLREGNIKEARRAYAELIDLEGENADRRLLSLMPVLSDEDPENADLLMRELAKPFKDSAIANYATSVMALQAGDADYAMKKSVRASELEPDWLKPKLVYGRALMISGQLDEAIEYVAGIIGDNPNIDPDARMELALMYMSAGRDDDALSQVNQIQLEHAGRTDALRLMGIINFRQNNLDAAQSDFQDLLASGSYTMDAMYYLARIADFRGDPKRAVQFYSQVREGQHALVSQRRASALTAIQLDDPDEALHNLDQFADRYPEYAIDMVIAKAQLLAALERNEEALAYYNKARQFRPENEQAALSRAALLLAMDRVDEAIAGYRVAVSRWPHSALTLNALGYTLVDRTDQYAEAEKLIRKALEFDPQSPAIIDSLGWVLYKTGRYEEALEQLEIAYSRFPDPEVAAHLVDVLSEMKRDDEALQLLVSAEARSPESDLLADVRERRFPGTKAARLSEPEAPADVEPGPAADAD